MKKLLKGIILSLILLLNSCATLGQGYTQVYYDYVIEGVIDEPGFVTDGYYSYHIVGNIPIINGYWELYPYDTRISLYNRYMVFQRWYYPDNNWILYHNGKHHMYIPRYKVPPRKPGKYYKQPPRKPSGNMRPPQNKKPTNPPRNNSGGNKRHR